MYEEETQQWEKSIPPMPALVSAPYVINYHSRIVVLGHNSHEVWAFNGETSQWYTAAPLPFPYIDLMQATIIHDICYLGGEGESKSIMCASMPNLLRSTDQQSSAQQQSVWTKLPADLPNECYIITLTNIGGTLLALGGINITERDAIHAYSPSTKSWALYQGQLVVPLQRCCHLVK